MNGSLNSYTLELQCVASILTLGYICYMKLYLVLLQSTENFFSHLTTVVNFVIKVGAHSKRGAWAYNEGLGAVGAPSGVLGGGLKMREWKMRYEQNCRGRQCRSGKYRSDNVWKAVKTENSKTLGMFAKTEGSQMVLNVNHEQRSGVYKSS